jgi:hypothetical protein
LHKVKEIHYRTPHLVFPNANLKPISVAITNIAACSGATYLLKDEVIALSKFVKENDPGGKLTRAATRKENARQRSTQRSYAMDLVDTPMPKLLASDDGLEQGEWSVEDFGDHWSSAEDEPIIISD